MKETKSTYRHRIYTEDKQRAGVIALVGQLFPAATFQYGQGLWEDELEASMVIEIITVGYGEVKALAERIKDFNEQDTVMITVEPVQMELV